VTSQEELAKSEGRSPESLFGYGKDEFLGAEVVENERLPGQFERHPLMEDLEFSGPFDTSEAITALTT